MNTTDIFLGPHRDLTKDEIGALKHIRAGVALPRLTYHKLEFENLAERRLGGWKLTQAGEYRLKAGK